MLLKVKFNEKIRNLFKKGKEFELKPLTLVVGDNGSGKSTFLQTLVNKVQHPTCNVIDFEKSGKPLSSFMFMDFEKDNPRTNGHAGIFSAISNFRSHGETNMDIICNDFSKFKNKLVLLDEPDQALSIRSINRMMSIFEKMIENGCQIIVAVHSETMMRTAKEVLSVEHGKWMSCSEFLATQKRPKKIRTVDSMKKNIYYVVKFITDDGEERWLPYNVSISDDHGISYAKRFRRKEIAKKFAERAMEKNRKECEKESNKIFYGSWVTKRYKSYEIVENEDMFPE